MFAGVQSVRERVAVWLVIGGAGKKPATSKYHRELAGIVLANWPAPDEPAESATAAAVAVFVERVAHYSAPRFNALVSLVRVLVPAAATLRRRKVHPKFVQLPGQLEFSAMLTELDRSPNGAAGLIVRFLALTGLRVGEARRLTWADVGKDSLTVRDGKNNRPRMVPFIGDVAGVLARLKALSDGPLVLPQAETRKSLTAACRRAGIPRLTHHDMRRVFATRCIESGVDVPTIARWMGHRDGGALLGKTYFHLLDGHSREMAARVAISA